MKSKSWLILIAFLMTSAGSTYWYACKIKGMCSDKSKSDIKETPKKEEVKIFTHGPLDFLWSDEKPKNGASWTEFYNRKVKELEEGKKLNIVGPYYSGEENTTSYSNLGIARAEAIKAYFVKTIGEENIQIQARMLSEGKEAAKTNPFDASRYITWVVNNDFIKEEDGKALIYFPSNSDKEITTREIVDYLNVIVSKLKNDDSYTLQVVGHTDDQGDAKFNYDLGMKRARQIKALLVSKGIEEDRINAMSRGEEDPIATNKSEEGRQQNRRTELLLNK